MIEALTLRCSHKVHWSPRGRGAPLRVVSAPQSLVLEQELPRGALRSQVPALELLRGAPLSQYALELLLVTVLARDQLWDSPKHKLCSSMPRTSADLLASHNVFSIHTS